MAGRNAAAAPMGHQAILLLHPSKAVHAHVLPTSLRAKGQVQQDLSQAKRLE
jgi:hypothetical protein